MTKADRRSSELSIQRKRANTEIVFALMKFAGSEETETGLRSLSHFVPLQHHHGKFSRPYGRLGLLTSRPTSACQPFRPEAAWSRTLRQRVLRAPDSDRSSPR